LGGNTDLSVDQNTRNKKVLLRNNNNG